MRDSRSLSLSLVFFPMSVFFKKLSRPFFFSKKIFFCSPFSLRFCFGLSSLSHARAHALTSRAKETNGEKMDGARVLPLFFLYMLSIFVISLLLSFACERFLSSFFLNISSSFFPNNTNNNLSFLTRLSLFSKRQKARCTTSTRTKA